MFANNKLPKEYNVLTIEIGYLFALVGSPLVVSNGVRYHKGFAWSQDGFRSVVKDNHLQM
jgi:hypothetical protein